MAKQRVNAKDDANGDEQGCSFCKHEADHAAIGHRMRALREAAGLAQIEVARALGFTGTYLCDLEAGRRNWTPKLIDRYLAAVKATKP